MEELNVKQEVLKIHLETFFPSLLAFSDKYLDCFFQPEGAIPDHIAYLCPLCLKNGIICTKEIGIAYHAPFSLDHFPPENVGGKLKVLVCKKCNNDAGRLYENSLSHKMNLMSFGKKIPFAKTKIKSEISNVTGKYPGIVTIREDGELEVSFKASDRVHAPLLDNWIETSKNNLDWKANVTIYTPDESKVSKALLKAAYLFCFVSWGYEFAFSNTGKMIREVLSGNSSYPLKNPSFWLGYVENSSEIPKGLCYLQESSEWRCFIVNLILKDEETGYQNVAGILIPGPNLADWEELYNIQTILDSEPPLNVRISQVLGTMLSPDFTNGYTSSWEVLQSL